MSSRIAAELSTAPVRREGRGAEMLWLVAVLAVALPFAVATIPPLVDAPGHLAQYAVQAAGPDSVLRRLFDFHWALRLNLGCDLLVEALRRAIGLVPAFRLVVAAIPVLVALGIAAIARVGGRRHAMAASWALLFTYSYPFLYGFLNFTFTMGLSFLGFALWEGLRGRPAVREPLFWLVFPALLISHAIGGGLLAVMVVASEIGRRVDRRPAWRTIDWRGLLIALRPLLSLAPLLVWQIGQPGSGLATRYDWIEKTSAIGLALRDQHHAFDIACVALCILVPIVGWRFGARYTPARGAIVIAFAALFILIPAEVSGAYFSDMRLVPPLAIAALALQDWDRVPRRLARCVFLAGFVLFGIRLAITAGSFADYDRAYVAEEGAVAHIAPGAKVLALVTKYCRASRNWRMGRLDHMPAMATVFRDAWTNTNWDNGKIHLLRVRFRPSPDFYNDPSHYVWPTACLSEQEPPKTAEDVREMRRTAEQVLPTLPLARVDYLWLVRTTLPDGPWRRSLAPVWTNGASTLYRVTAPPPPRS